MPLPLNWKLQQSKNMFAFVYHSEVCLNNNNKRYSFLGLTQPGIQLGTKNFLGFPNGCLIHITSVRPLSYSL